MNRDIKPIVYSILEKDKFAREDTMYLIQQTIIKMLDVNQGTAFGIVIQGMKYKGISFEAIAKCKKDYLDTTENLYGDREIWKDIPGYEGLYQASNFGRVKSTTRYKKLIKTSENDNGYLRVCLTDKNHIPKTLLLHRIIAKTFLRLPKENEQINHINGNKKDNRVENLEWCSQAENMRHAFKNNLIFRGKGRENPKAKAVKQISTDGKLIKKWDCISDAMRALKVNTNNISSCCTGKRKTAYGYKWEYIEG